MKWISDILDLILPRHCTVCGDVLAKEENHICLNCLVDMPLLPVERQIELEQMFRGIVRVERASSYMYYRKGSPYNNLLHQIKYNNRPQIATHLAMDAAKKIKSSGFFNNIDFIVPLPLSASKKRRRGYNQCDYIAQGISKITGIPIAPSCVERTKANETQTHKNREERWKNVQGIFKVTSPDTVRNRHILLVDDVLTTGATIASCAKSITDAGGTVSIFTIAYSSNSF